SMPVSAKKVILLTGASAGLGASLAREIARLGHGLVLTARREDRLISLRDEILALSRDGRSPISVHVVAADLDAVQTPARLVAEAVAGSGGPDVLINNAGFGLPTLFADANPNDLRRQLDVNLVAPLMLTRWALPHLLARRGLVINIGSAITCVANSGL